MTESAQGKVVELIRCRDWSASSLGPPAGWPATLRTIFELILHNKVPMLVAWGPQLNCLYNEAFAALLGVKHPDSLGLQLRDVWSEIWPDVNALIGRAQRGETVYREHQPLKLNRNGSPRQTWFTFSISPVFDESDAFQGVYCVCSETTGLVMAARQRADEIDHLRSLFKQAPGMVVVVREPEHIYELVNEAYVRFFGYRELIGKPVREAIPELVGQGFITLLDQVYASGVPYSGRAVPIQIKDPLSGAVEERYVDFIYQPIRGPDGNICGIFAQGNDVTDAVRATQALRESERRLLALANTIPHLAWMADADGQICWYNDRWYEYTGTTYEQMRGWGWQSVHHPGSIDAVVQSWRNSLATGEPFEMVFPLRSVAGNYRSFYTRAAPLRDMSGTIVQWFGTNTDIHAIEEAQAELRAASQRKDEFLAMLAHELRNPLAPISTAAQLLNMPALDPVMIKTTSEVIARQAAHMTGLVDDLLDVSRVTRGLVNLQLQSVNLKNVLAEAVEQVNPLLESRRHHLEIHVTNESACVAGDKTRLIQVFANILNNAAKYTPEHGHITVRLAVKPSLAEVVIQDDGMGIDAELLPHVFELFSQAARSPDRSQGGLGLGLALVKSLVELQGGSVVAHSDGVGKGSRFHVSLPREQGAVEAPPGAAPSVVGTAGARDAVAVMVVDDNVDAAQTLALLLELHGYQVAVAHHALEALQLAAEHCPQVFILDIGLPDIDGYELARRLRQMPQTAQSLFIAATGYSQREDQERSMAVGFAHHLVKPVDVGYLLRLIASASEAAHGS